MPCIDGALTTATLKLKATSDSAVLDAEVLLAFVLKKERCYLRAWSEKKLNDAQIFDFEQMLNQRIKGIPIAYLIGEREFWSREFKVTPDVLIPRPDTELLIELSLALIPEDRPYQLLDLGTGSGVIAITLAAERPNITVIATDISLASLKIAKENAQRYHLSNLYFQQSRWFDTIKPNLFDLIVSNPPYIAENDPHLQQGDLRFEPQHALIAKNNGLDDLSIIAASALTYLKANGTLMCEHGSQQQKAVQGIFQQFFYESIQTHTDLSHLPRVTSGQKKCG
ncbi:MAG: peptide chain release factor N(5)-glutamine methyltransferase [Methylococcales bacterium]|nr:peptide chain release factor N(5)-glutamine methyltransferase [Methylococcales bacterium]